MSWWLLQNNPIKQFGLSNERKYSEDVLQSWIDGKNCCCIGDHGRFWRTWNGYIQSKPKIPSGRKQPFVHVYVSFGSMTNVRSIPGTSCNYGLLFSVICFCYLWKRPMVRLEFVGVFFTWDELDVFRRDLQTKQRVCSVDFCQILELCIFCGSSANCHCSPLIHNAFCQN